ncbi:hypothetical protein ACNFH5_09640 [Pseudomonas sp. NY15435]|uniref:hypothetical protein n=1 Tax=Pseudomonas sp. NY15435 TaxID=3400358 RepID=UPI003A83BBC5
MVDHPKWRKKRDDSGKVIPKCWQTDSGYTVAEVERTAMRFAVTRPGSKLPSFYAKTRDEVLAVIKADMEAIEVAHADT